MTKPWVYTPAKIAKIKGMLGRASTGEIAEAVGVSVPSLKSWLRDKKLTAARPISETICAAYNRLRQRAFQCGLRLSAQNNRVSLWVAVKENLSFAEADLYLRYPNRKQRQLDVEAVYESGLEKLRRPVPRPAAAIVTPPPAPPPEIRIVFAPPPLRVEVFAGVDQPMLNGFMNLAAAIKPSDQAAAG